MGKKGYVYKYWYRIINVIIIKIIDGKVLNELRKIGKLRKIFWYMVNFVNIFMSIVGIK